jgi:hypothetical protein
MSTRVRPIHNADTHPVNATQETSQHAYDTKQMVLPTFVTDEPAKTAESMN